MYTPGTTMQNTILTMGLSNWTHESQRESTMEQSGELITWPSPEMVCCGLARQHSLMLRSLKRTRSGLSLAPPRNQTKAQCPPMFVSLSNCFSHSSCMYMSKSLYLEEEGVAKQNKTVCYWCLPHSIWIDNPTAILGRWVTSSWSSKNWKTQFC